MNIIRSPFKKSMSLTEQVYQDLRSAIITGKISGGTRMVASAIASEMDVSRTPVREALQRLAMEGFLFSIPRAGYIVEEMSDHDIRDLFTTRMAIEQLAARWAVDKITPEELERLEENLKMSQEVLISGLTQKMTELDTEFHGIIYKASRSKTLYRICQTLSDHTLKFRIALIHIPEMARRTKEDHQRIYRALASRDPEELNASIEAHLVQAKENITALLERFRQEAFVTRALTL